MPQCSAKTLKETQCTRNATQGVKCAQHARLAGEPVVMKKPQNVYATVSACNGRQQADCTKPLCNWTTVKKTGNSYCRSATRTNFQ